MVEHVRECFESGNMSEGNEKTKIDMHVKFEGRDLSSFKVMPPKKRKEESNKVLMRNLLKTCEKKKSLRCYHTPLIKRDGKRGEKEKSKVERLDH